MVPENIQIVERFFIALDSLIAKGIYRSYYDFAQTNHFDRSQLNQSKLNHASRRFELAWIAPLVAKHNLNATWLFTGHGARFLKVPKHTTTTAFIKKGFVSI